jgi:uncharacterized membrane protein
VNHDATLTAVRIAWAAVAALAVISYVTIVAPAERAIRAIAFQAYGVNELANRNERIIASAGALQAARQRVERDVAALKAENTPAKASLGVLRLLQKEADARAVTVTGMSPGDSARDISIGLRGRYRNVLAVVDDISRRDVLLDVTGTSIASATGSDGESLVNATLQATVYHNLADIEKEKNVRETALR